MQAVLTEPIVADYVPAVKPPWAVLMVAVGLFSTVVPRETLPEFLAGSALAAAVGVVVNFVSRRRNIR